jgi:hypothetical protein
MRVTTPVEPQARKTDFNPLDALLRQLAQQVPSARTRAWARQLLERGEAAVGGTFTPPPPKPLRPRRRQMPIDYHAD